MKLILGTIALTCVLAVPALAGEIPTCNCRTLTADVPTIGSKTADKGEIPGTDTSADLSDTQTSLLTTVLLTIVSLAVR